MLIFCNNPLKELSQPMEKVSYHFIAAISLTHSFQSHFLPPSDHSPTPYHIPSPPAQKYLTTQDNILLHLSTVISLQHYTYIMMMLSSLKLTSVTYIGRQQQKKLTLIISYLIDLPQAAEFIHPVDWQELQLHDYPLVVKHPMNLLKIQEKLKAREYRTIEEVLDHIELVWDNCKAYNPEGAFYILADKMERAFKKMIRNYLPNIQVVVPKPSLSNTNPQQSQIPLSNAQINHMKSQPKQSFRPSIAPLNPYAPNNSSAYDEPPSMNEQGENLPEVEEIPQSEKNRFHQRLRQLTQQELLQIVTIVQESCAEGFKEIGGGRCQILLDSIDLETFKKMNQRIDDFLDNDKGTILGSKKIKA